MDNYFIYHILGAFRAKDYFYNNEQIGGESDNRGWKKNLLEVEQVQDFTAGGHNFGEVFVVKSEFSPTSYAIQDKWAPVYEYYTKDENGKMVRIGSGKINPETGKMETTISIDGQDRSEIIRNESTKLEKEIEEGTVIQFNSNEYTGTSTKTSRKDIEQALTTKSIQAYLGKGKQITDITQVKDIPVVIPSENNISQTKNAYVVAYVENGFESYEIVCIGEDGKCEKYPRMNQDMFAKKELYFYTGNTTVYEQRKGLNIIDKKQALETFKTEAGLQYSVYRDKDGNLRVAQMLEHANGVGKYAEELDTYSVMHGDIDRIKEQTKEEYSRSLTLLKEKNNRGLKINEDELSL